MFFNAVLHSCRRIGKFYFAGLDVAKKLKKSHFIIHNKKFMIKNENVIPLVVALIMLQKKNRALQLCVDLIDAN